MAELTAGKATICIVNYKTLKLTKCCLRSIRKFTKYPHEVIVIDNDSNDESLDYLRSLDWIRLIQRNTKDDASGGHSHSAALDLGLANCNTEFFISMHSDTLVQKENWLTELIGYFGRDKNISCVGSGKIELVSKWRQFLKAITDFKTFKRKLLRAPDPLGKYRYYNRTICSLYRTDILRREKLSFLKDREIGLTSGKKLYFELLERGYETVELSSSVMGRYIVHLAHATQVVNQGEFSLRKKTISKCNRLIEKVISSAEFKSILNDDSLDK